MWEVWGTVCSVQGWAVTSGCAYPHWPRMPRDSVSSPHTSGLRKLSTCVLPGPQARPHEAGAAERVPAMVPVLASAHAWSYLCAACAPRDAACGPWWHTCQGRPCEEHATTASVNICVVCFVPVSCTVGSLGSCKDSQVAFHSRSTGWWGGDPPRSSL